MKIPQRCHNSECQTLTGHPYRKGLCNRCYMNRMYWKRRHPKNDMHVRTYFIQGQKTGLIKIGKTNGTVVARRDAMQVGSPDRLQILAQVDSDIEQSCHEKFAKHCHHGEWFRPVRSLLAFIKLLKIKEIKANYSLDIHCG